MKESERQRDVTAQNASEQAAPEVGAEALDAIGRRLQHVYGQLLAEPLPEKVLAMLKKLSEPETDSGGER